MRKTVSYLRELPPDSLPRERLVNFGAKALSNQELLAILLGTGSQDLRVLDLSLAVLTHFRDLSELKSASLDQFEAIKGIGPVKAIQLQACIELGQRIAQTRPPKLGTLTSTKAAGQWLHTPSVICSRSTSWPSSLTARIKSFDNKSSLLARSMRAWPIPAKSSRKPSSIRLPASSSPTTIPLGILNLLKPTCTLPSE